MRRQREISAACRRRWVGRTIEVLVEKAAPDGRRGVGRSQGQAPEIDGVVRLRSSARAAPLVPGQFVFAHVTGSTAYDLEATVTDGRSGVQAFGRSGSTEVSLSSTLPILNTRTPERLNA